VIALPMGSFCTPRVRSAKRATARRRSFEAQAKKLIGRGDHGIQLWHLARLVIRLPSLG
jgi:hypothetical protein